MHRRRLLTALSSVALLLAVKGARAQDASPETREIDSPTPKKQGLDREEPFATKSGYTQIFATVMGGTGLRFNNPYRLSTPLGDDAESVSRTAAYIDIGLAMTLGSPLGFQHGATLRTTAAVEGIGQVLMTPSYFGWRRWRSLAAFARAGIPFVLTPDVTWGVEAAGGGAWFFLGGFGVVAEIVGDVFYGAGTAESSVVSYPVISGQLGLITTLELLP